MKEIKKNLEMKKERIEKNFGLYIAAVLAAIIYGVTMEMTFWPTFFVLLGSFNLFTLYLEYKKLGRAENIFKSVEERLLKEEITEQQAIHELQNTEV